MNLNEKKALIGSLYYDQSKQDPDLKFAIAYLDKEETPRWSKWLSFLECCNDDNFLMRCNNRTVMKHELILDIDRPTKEECKEKFDEIIKELLEKEYKFKAYFTGSKGYHIHISNFDWYHYSKFKREEEKIILINHFACDPMKANDKAMIAMEEIFHWKTGIPKTLVILNE